MADREEDPVASAKRNEKEREARADARERSVKSKEEEEVTRDSRFTVNRRDFLYGAGAAVAAPTLGPIAGAQAQEVVDIEIWQWAPGFDAYIEAFNASHPGIRLHQVATANSADTGLKLRNALLAGQGGPDVTFCNYWMVSSMDYAGAFYDITEDALPFKDGFVPAFWEASTFNGKVKLMPLDAPPIMQIYRADLFDEYGLKLPETWDEFAAAAELVRTKRDNQYLTNAFFMMGEWATALCWQAGWEGFKLDGETITIDINGPASMKVAEYWQKLIDGKLVGTDVGNNGNFFEALDDGRYIDVMEGSWFPAYASSNANKTLGKWRVGFVPQWNKGDDFSTLFGGAGFGVYSGTKHPKEAWEVVKWLTLESPAKEWWVTKNSLVLTLKSVLEDPAMQNATYPLTGDQKVNEVAFKAVGQMKRPFNWAPFQDVVLTTMQEELAAAASGERKLVEGFNRAQDRIVAYAKDQGFTVV